MRKIYFAIVTVMIIALLTLSACSGNGGKPSATTAKEETPAATTTDVVETEETTTEETTAEETAPAVNLPELTADGITDDGQTYALYENEILSIEFPDTWTVDTSIIADTLWVSGLYRFDLGYLGIEIKKASWSENTVQNTARMMYENYQYTEESVNCYPATLQGRESYVVDSYNGNNVGRDIYSITPDGEQFVINIVVFNRGIVFVDFDYSDIASEMAHALNTLSFK